MTLTAAIQRIQAAEACDEAQALLQFRSAIADGNVPYRWADEPGPRLKKRIDSRTWHRVADTIILPTRFWQTIPISVPDGTVLDDRAVYRKGNAAELRAALIAGGTLRFRPLLILRDAVDQWWPLPNDGGGTKRGKSAPINTGDRDRPRRPSLEKIRAAAHEVYERAADDPPNMTKAEQLIRAELGSASRLLVRDVLREPEFANRRKPRGNQPRR